MGSAPTDMIQRHQNAICQHTDVGYSCVLSSASQICFVHDKVWYAYPRAPSSWGDINSDFDSSSDESLAHVLEFGWILGRSTWCLIVRLQLSCARIGKKQHEMKLRHGHERPRKDVRAPTRGLKRKHVLGGGTTGAGRSYICHL